MLYMHNGTHSYLLEYMYKCRTGQITVGHEIELTFQRIERDFNNPDVRINFEEAHTRIKFIEKECKHFEAPFAGQPFILELFQKAIIESIYIFKIYDDELGKWVRKYKELLLLVARKNGKTPFVAALVMAEWFCGLAGTKILCSSNDYEQASIMFDAINSMREESKKLQKVTRKNIKGIFFGNPKKPKYKGKFSYQNKGTIRKISAKAGAKDGRNIRVGAVDEVWELKDNTSVMPIRQALATQDEPLFIELTTEGTVNDGYLDERVEEARQVLTGELVREKWQIWLYTQDSEAEVWDDDQSWYKSNPGLGVIKRWSFLREMIAESKTNKGTRIFTLAKDFNIKQNGTAAWLEEEEYKNTETFNIEDLRGCIGIGGIDLSETTDLMCSKLMVMKPGSTKKYFLTKYWIPESKLKKGSFRKQNDITQLKKQDDIDYRECARLGLLEICPGNENDFSRIVDWFMEMYKSYGIRTYRIGYDNWQMKDVIKGLKDMGCELDRIRMSYDDMSNPMKLVEADLRDKLLIYNNNILDEYCFKNTGIDVDGIGRVMPVKIKQDHRIDGSVTSIICYAIYNMYRSEFRKLVGF